MAQADLAPVGVSWLKFGDDMVYFGAGKPWSEFNNRAGRALAPLREHPDEVARERLHVVVQKGRLFQREHPEVPVLIDKGRFLLVDLERKHARKIGNSDAMLFRAAAWALKTTGTRTPPRYLRRPPARSGPSGGSGHPGAREPDLAAIYEADLTHWCSSLFATRPDRSLSRPATSSTSSLPPRLYDVAPEHPGQRLPART